VISPLEVRRAAERALAFLLDSRNKEGWWLDFDVQGPSNVWVSAYVGASVALSPEVRAREAALRAWHLISTSPSPSGGWAYVSIAPGDADSTAWALRLAEAVSRSSTAAGQAGYAFLMRHLRDGGLATFIYEVAGPLFRYTRLSESWDGWCATHTCVTAAAATLHSFPARSELLAHLRRQQSQTGAWDDAYWWPDAEYASALAYEALQDALAAAASHRGDPGRLAAAALWAASRISEDGAVHTPLDPAGSPFATACALRILARADRNAETDVALEHGLAWLMTSQQPDGNWQRSARMRIPPPDLLSPDRKPDWGLDGRGDDSIGTIVIDTNAVFTTATVVQALLTWLQITEGD
jgi:squalene-hopene/tetraprenyl-beta-curcumene cyclase